ncbi:MAG TPA: FxsC protein [Actinospica sp.]|nr:FxsC protein [Actinospica sp.]
MPNAHETAAEATPYYFLSYARRPGANPLVRRFQNDLRERVRGLAGDHARAVTEIDSELPVDDAWPERVARGLARCRVFVALYSGEYFSSEHCGREWQAFAERQGSGHRIAVLWQPVRAHDLPVDVPRPSDDAADPPTYLRYGLSYLLRHLAEHRDEYELVLRRLARQIVEAGERDTPVRAERFPDYRSVPDAFAAHPDPITNRGRIRIVIAAPVVPNLPAGADAAMYGPEPADWKPYLPDFPGPIGQTARRAVEAMNFGAVVEPLPLHPPAAPTLLIIDPWSARVPTLRLMLSSFDERSHREPWVRPVVAWNRNHPSSRKHVAELIGSLEAAMPRCRSRYRPDSPRLFEGLATVREFRTRLPVLVGTAERRYLSEIGRDLTERPGPEAASRRPRLSGPGPGFTAGGADRLPDTEVWR